MRLFVCSAIVSDALGSVGHLGSYTYQDNNRMTVDRLTSNGYEKCFEAQRNGITADIKVPDETYSIFMGCGHRDTIGEIFKLGAFVTADLFLTETNHGTSHELARGDNGVYTYYQKNRSWGFSGHQTVRLNSADDGELRFPVRGSLDTTRMSIHGNPNNYLYRCGSTKDSTDGMMVVMYCRKNEYVKKCSSFDECSAPCGGGVQSCANECVGGSWGSAGCPRNQMFSTQSCNTQACNAGNPVLEYENTEKTLKDAIEHCSARSTDEGIWELFYPTNENDFQFVKESREDPNLEYWLGITIADKSSWTNMLGKDVSENLLKWDNKPEPDADGNFENQCVQMNSDGSLSDENCNEEKPFICRWIPHNKNLCPSSECWRTEIDGTCTLKEADCTGLSVTCSKDGMSLVFPRELFNSDETTVFKTAGLTQDCSPADDGTKVNWNTPLGECGMTVTKTDTNVVFTQSVSVTSNRESTDVVNDKNDNVKVFTSDGIVTSVNFKCNFPLTAEVSSAELTLERPESVSATATGVGSWDEAFALDVYNADFTETIDSLTTNIGDTINIMASFKINSANLLLNWYLKDCKVIENKFEITIIKNTCYAGLVGSAFAGVSTDDPIKDKIVRDESKFKFISFGLGDSEFVIHTKQHLVCDIVFCTDDDQSVECELPSKACPSDGNDAFFRYTPYGV